MANKGVLKRAEGVRSYCCGANRTSPCVKCATIDTLSAALRKADARIAELEKDKARMDGIFASKDIVINAFTEDDEDWREIGNREQLDAALKGE